MGENVSTVLMCIFALCSLASTQTVVEECPKSCFCSPQEGKEIAMQLISCTNVFPDKIPGTVNQLVIVHAFKPSLSRHDTTKLGSLHKLDLIHLSISTIENNTFSVENFENLTALALSNNNIATLPFDDLSRLQKLEKLCLDGNIIEHLPDGALEKLLHLKVLHLHKNRLKEMPQNLPPHLTILLLNENNIGYLNFSSYGQELTDLNLCGNKYLNVKESASVIRTLKFLCLGGQLHDVDPSFYPEDSLLETLVIQSNNELTSHTLSGIENLHKLKTLVISDAKMNILPGYRLKALNELQSISFIHTNIKVPVNFDELFFDSMISLKELDISGSSWLSRNVMENENIMKSLFKIKTLKLRNTGLITLSTDILNFLPNLEFLDISKNPLTCNCKLLNIVCKVIERKLILSFPDQSKCFEPVTHETFNVLDYKSYSLECDENQKRHPKAFFNFSTDFGENDMFTIMLDNSKTDSPPRDEQYNTNNSLVYVVIGLIIIIALLSFIVFFILIKYIKVASRKSRRSTISSIF